MLEVFQAEQTDVDVRTEVHIGIGVLFVQGSKRLRPRLCSMLSGYSNLTMVWQEASTKILA